MTPIPHAWLDPECDDVEIPRGALVSLSDLHALERDCLGEALLIQRLITCGALDLDLGTADSRKPLESWGHTLASRIAVLLPARSKGSSPIEQRARRRHQEQLLKGQASWPDLASTTSTASLVCSDSQPPEFGLPEQIYPGHSPDTLLDSDDFPRLIDLLVRTVSPSLAPAWIRSKPGLREALAVIVAETVKNTHDHARQDVDLSDVAHSLRGLHARYYPLTEIASLVDGRKGKTVSPALQFARSFLPEPMVPGVRRLNRTPVDGVLELSVFDSGPGMAAKWLRRSVEGVPVQSQLEAVVSCFAKGRTTTGTQGRGYGLAKVLLRLKDLHGFIGVRTNQLHVFRGFGSMADIAHVELGDGTRVPEEKLFDWKRHLVTTASERAAVKGTVVSFILPMGGQ